MYSSKLDEATKQLADATALIAKLRAADPERLVGQLREAAP